MEKAHFPLRKTWQSQGMNGSASHKDTFAIDFGKLTTYPNDTQLFAPFTGKIVYKGSYNNGNGIVIESLEKVKYADGTEDHMSVATWHDSDTTDIALGQVYKQDEKYTDMGTANAVGQFHTHLEVIRGKYKGWSGTTSQGALKFINAIEPYKALFLTEDTILKYSDYPWKVLPKEIKRYGTPVETNLSLDQVLVNTKILNVRETPNGKLLGYINEGLYNVLNRQDKDGYTWYEVEPSKWIAYDKSWAIFYSKKVIEQPIKNKPVEPPKEDEPIVIPTEPEKPKDEPTSESDEVIEDKPKQNVWVLIFKFILNLLKGGK
jgi:hypothetical protein